MVILVSELPVETGVHRAEYKVPVPSTNPILFRNAFLGPCFLFRGAGCEIPTIQSDGAYVLSELYHTKRPRAQSSPVGVRSRQLGAY